MRTVLVDWLVEVHQKFKFLPETLFLCVNVMDRFLSQRVCALNKFQLVGLAALFIAAKTEEVYCPPVSQFSFMADNAYTDEDMLRAEQYILRVLDFNVWSPGPFSFLRRISKVDDYNVNNRTLAKYFAEISLLDHRFLPTPPSLVASASMWLARKLHNRHDWDHSFVWASGYTESEIMGTVELLVDWLCKPPDEESFFYRKYSSRRYGRASQAAHQWAQEMQNLNQLTSSDEQENKEINAKSQVPPVATE
jgi:G2/mitotic-specific cyclin 1/2